jgi:hypothetical protein
MRALFTENYQAIILINYKNFHYKPTKKMRGKRKV